MVDLKRKIIFQHKFDDIIIIIKLFYGYLRNTFINILEQYLKIITNLNMYFSDLNVLCI